MDQATERAPAASSLRTAGAYLATDLSARLDLASPVEGVPAALQIAERNLRAEPSNDVSASGASATGFALLWDGAQWRLRYYRGGTAMVDTPFSAAPPAADAWYQVELALEPRSAAAWVWPRGEPQPAQPNAVFAPPGNAVLDGARPRALYLPSAPVANVVLEGATRD